MPSSAAIWLEGVTGLCCLWAACASAIGARKARTFEGRDRRSRSTRAAAYRSSLFFWMALTCLLLGLSVVKSDGSLGEVTGWGREVAQSQGWYLNRGVFQATLIVSVVIGGITALCCLLMATRDLMRRHVPALVGIIVIAIVTGLGLVSQHALDAILRYRVVGFTIELMVEIVGGILIMTAAIANAWWWRPIIRTTGHGRGAASAVGKGL